MQNAFQITEEDVRIVLEKAFSKAFGPFSEDDVEKAFDGIDADMVESAALSAGDDFDEQTNAAHSEIERQLSEGFSKSWK